MARLDKKKIFLLILFSLLVFFLIFSKPIKASLAEDLLKGVKNIFIPPPEAGFTMESNISLAPDGDVNQNNQIDAGDVVRFTYKLTNTTNEGYSFATLKTNIDRKQLNFIHNVSGTTGLKDAEGTITFRNLRINPQEERIISFDARINYYQEDKTITTEPEFLSAEAKSIASSLKEEVLATRLSAEEVKKRLETRGLIFHNTKKQ